MNPPNIATITTEEQLQPGVPILIHNLPQNNIYGSMKDCEERLPKHSSNVKYVDTIEGQASYLKGNINRSILKAKMEIRTGSDCQDNEYNLILK